MFILMILVFVAGYVCIALEHPLKVDKAATALVLGSMMWVLFLIGHEAILERTNEDGSLANQKWAEYLQENPNASQSDYIIAHESIHHLGETGETLFFLLGAMTIVGIIDRHNGFTIITDKIKTRNKKKLLWLLSVITFFMSAILDNLTTTIVMVTLLNKLIEDRHQRWIYAGMIVLAANSGGAWSPIGDVTTIMLWIGTQVTTVNIITAIIIPSIISMLVPLIVLSCTLKGDFESFNAENQNSDCKISPKLQKFTLGWGLMSLIMVPILKTTLHLPPYMGMLMMLGIFWVLTDVIHRKNSQSNNLQFTVNKILESVDTPTILFFLGILTAVGALQSAGQLSLLAEGLKEHVGNVYGIGLAIGVLSSIVDNVPLVAASMGMYPIEAADAVGYAANFVQDGIFWQFLSYTAGTGGSILIIGSAAGVAAMGIEKIDFVWYLKHISWLALLGFLCGAGVFILQKMIFA